MNKKKITRWIKLLILVYCILGLALYYSQDYIFFHPVVLNRNQAYTFSIPHREINIPYSEESNINIIQFTDSTVPNKGVVLYFHGNRKNISWYAKFPPAFTSRGYEVWMIDYPGYGKSTGHFTEPVLYDWALQLYKLARTRYKPAEIVIYGKSMGTGIAAQLASVRDCKALVLESPYYSFPSLLSNYLPIYPVNRMIHYKIPTWQFLQQVTAPITIFHGTSDWVIPLRNAERLKPFLKKNDQFIIVEGSGHNGLTNYPVYDRVLDSLLR